MKDFASSLGDSCKIAHGELPEIIEGELRKLIENFERIEALGIGNGGGKQGGGNQTPIDDTDPTRKVSIDPKELGWYLCRTKLPRKKLIRPYDRFYLPMTYCFRINFPKVTDTDTNRKLLQN